MEDNKNHVVHKMTLNDRKNCIITGIKDVQSFEEKEIFLLTENGRLQIKGMNLHIRQLDLEKKVTEIEGRVDAFIYLSKDKSEQKSLKKRIFQ